MCKLLPIYVFLDVCAFYVSNTIKVATVLTRAKIRNVRTLLRHAFILETSS
jgi:hypothetical protein